MADDIAYLCENGALVIVDGEVALKREMPRDLSLELCHAIMEEPGCDLLVSSERTSYVLKGTPDFAEHMRDVVGNDVTCVARPEDIPETPVKVSYHATDEVMRRVRGRFEERFGRTCKVVTSGATWMGVMARGVDKGLAMRELGRLLAEGLVGA